MQHKVLYAQQALFSQFVHGRMGTEQLHEVLWRVSEDTGKHIQASPKT